MTLDQAIILGVLFGSLGCFIWGRWRYDVVALMALLLVAVTGLVPANQVFSGFGHPAVITVAAVLVISQALTNSGVVDEIGKKLSLLQGRRVMQIAALTGLVASCSAFMNNIGALALFMPLALQLCQQENRPTSEVLMPLSFGSLLGGLVTLIGTPPNVIIANYRQELTGEPFGMFAFTPVGLGVALVGVAFISLIGWRLLPNRGMGAKPGTLFDITAYITEARVPEKSKLVGKELREVENLGKGDVSILALV
ncbi:MAG: anion permease, partial [Gammaproteobacteria bacterium]|nr:anion permease [Gammaproteobacteria bacterium]